MGRAPTKTLSAALATSTLVASALLAAPAAFAAETCDGKTVTKVVSSGTYEGTSGQDVVIVKGQATVKLGAGSDTVCVQTDGRVTAYLGEGQDKFFGAGKKGQHWVHGGPGRNDIYVGNGGSVVLAGDSGDVIVGGSGIDNVVGGSGHDDIKGGDGDDTLYGFGGIDLIKGGKGDDLIVGGLDRDELYGDAGNDTIYGDYDFTDMVYLPVRLGLRPPEYAFVCIDEAQDLSRLNLELIMRLIGVGARALFVGDPYQAIYAFAGADARSLERIVERTGATRLPLSVSFRCPVRHVVLARRFSLCVSRPMNFSRDCRPPWCPLKSRTSHWGRAESSSSWPKARASVR